MDLFARDLQVGDSVKCGSRWLTVKSVKDEWMIYVIYDNGLEERYSRDHRLIVMR